MQVFFIENAKSFEETVNECHDSLNKKTSSLVKDIVEGTSKSRDELLVMQKKIIVDVILQTALGSPSNQEVCALNLFRSRFSTFRLIFFAKVVAEITSALNSIMTEHDFENFAALERDSRLDSLREIRQIVCGIVLFNKDTGIGNTMDIPDRKFTLPDTHLVSH